MSDYEKLTDREIDALIAERVMGTRALRTASGKGHYLNTPYCSNDSCARLVRDRIAELGLQQQFIEVFLRQENKPPSMFNAMQQTPREQCIAALEALDGRA